MVSLSIGDNCLFRFGNTGSRGRPLNLTLRETGLS